MKKLFYSLFAFAAMAMTSTSCSDELDNGGVTNSNEAVVSFKVQLENEAGSRALIGDGTKAKNLFFAVYKAKDADKLGDEIEALAQTAVPVKDDLTATINTRLVKGQSYNFVFWAQKDAAEDGTYYNVTNMGNIMVKYNADNRAANNEDRDAFYAVRKNLTVTGPINETITLKRPFAQVNVGTKIGSLAEAAKAEVVIDKSEITIKQVATELDPYSGQVKSPTDVTFLLADIPHTKGEYLKNVTIDSVTSDYEYLSMNYILVNSDNKNTAGVVDGAQKELVNATFSIYAGTEKINTFEIPSIPVQRNWRTNIIGDILSETVTFNIVIDPKFDNDENYMAENELAYAAENGGVVTLTEDLVIDGTEIKEMVIKKSVVLNLNGHEIKATDKNILAALKVDGGSLTINGKGTIRHEGGSNNLALAAVNGGTVIINGGTFSVGDDANGAGNACIEANASTIEINGGEFSSDKAYSGKYWVLNLKDKTNAMIVVKGGKFTNFNPAAGGTENPASNFVAEGYEAKKDATKDIWYVVKSGSTVATTATELKKALTAADAQVAMMSDMAIDETLDMTAGNTFDGLGNELTLNVNDNGTYALGINVKGGEIKNLIIDGENKKSTSNQKGYRALWLNNVTKDVVIDNLHISGVAYTMNTGGTVADGLKLTVSNSTLIGWTSYDKFASALFNNVHFGVGSYYKSTTNPEWDGCIRPYVTTTLSNCTFDEGFRLLLDKLATGATITLKNCMVGNQEVTMTNIEALLGVAYDSTKIKF